MIGRIGVTIAVVVLLLFASVFLPLPGEDFRKEGIHSLRVVDRNGLLLREFLNDEQGRGQWRSLDRMAPSLQRATIAIEDRRFYSHVGVDPLALLRATVENVKSMQFVSGGSTLTQQVIRNVYHHQRSVSNKVIEAWRALRLERMMSKDAILEQYLNRAPYGNQLIGVEAAAQHYFGKPAHALSLAESAFLAALPNAPSTLNPHRNLDAALSRQHLVLRRMREQDLIGDEEYDRAVSQPITINSPEADFRAPHVVAMAVGSRAMSSGISFVQTTIDYPLQQNIQFLLRGHLATLAKRNVTNGSVVVIENATGEVCALVGSANYFDEQHNGQVNGATALRQPGSAIKPFTYGLALEAGYSAATLLADIPLHITDDKGDYIPENYDKRYHGPVRMRTALACSYNIPAVRTLQFVGTENLLQRLRLAGISSLTRTADYYGFGLTLGNAEVSLLDLTNAYASIANGGMWRPARLVLSSHDVSGETIDIDPVQPAHGVFGENVAFLLTNILSDPVARRPAFGNAFHFPFQCAVKTGTTKDYRDNWTMGFTTEYTVGVWVGNFDGSEMRGVSGITGAGQIFADVMMLLHMPPHGNLPGEFVAPREMMRVAVCPRSGKLPSPDCNKSIEEWFIGGTAPVERCDVHQRYRFQGEAGRMVDRVFEVLPAEFSEWASQQQMEKPPSASVRVNKKENKTADRVERLTILSPNDGDLFKLDPTLRREYQTVKIVAAVPERAASVKVLVDGEELLEYDRKGVWWHLKQGSHNLQLVGMIRNRNITSEQVTIHVK